MSVNVPPTSTSIVLRSCVVLIRSALLHGQPVVADLELAVGQALTQPVEVDLDVVCDRMTRRQVLGLDLGEAPGAVEFDDPDPVRVGRECVLALDHGLVDLPRIAVVDLTGVLVVLARGAEVVPAHMAMPAL